MEKLPIAGPDSWLPRPLVEALLRRRNAESLSRMAVSVERRTSL
jgi:hypothetical protein